MGIGWVSYSGAIEREGILSNDLSCQGPVKIEKYISYKSGMDKGNLIRYFG